MLFCLLRYLRHAFMHSLRKRMRPALWESENLCLPGKLDSLRASWASSDLDRAGEVRTMLGSLQVGLALLLGLSCPHYPLSLSLLAYPLCHHGLLFCGVLSALRWAMNPKVTSDDTVCVMQENQGRRREWTSRRGTFPPTARSHSFKRINKCTIDTRSRKFWVRNASVGVPIHHTALILLTS